MITAKHRIITDECRKRPKGDILRETLYSVEEAIVAALDGWPPGDGTKIHVRVDIERSDDKAYAEFKEHERSYERPRYNPKTETPDTRAGSSNDGGG